MTSSEARVKRGTSHATDLNADERYAILTKREVKMDGCWPSSFSRFSFFFLRDEVEVNKNAEKNEANTQPF